MITVATILVVTLVIVVGVLYVAFGQKPLPLSADEVNAVVKAYEIAPTPTTAAPADQREGSQDARINNPCTKQPFTTVTTDTGMQNPKTIVSPLNATQYSVQFSLATNAEGTALTMFTAAHIGVPMGIVMNGQVLSTPVIQAALT